jgi:hypothetical protein
MAVMDEFKEERAALKNGTPKEKFAYFIDYYKWHVIVTVAVIAAVVSFIVELVNGKDNAIYICMLNTLETSYDGLSTDSSATDELAAKFADYADIDTDKYEVFFDTSMTISSDTSTADEYSVTSTEKFATYLAAAEMDVLVTDADSMKNYAYQSDFCDLRDILTEEQLEKYEPYFYYIDNKTMEEWNEFLDDINNLTGDTTLDAPDPRHPEDMAEPIPVGIYLDDCEEIRQYFYFRDEENIVASVFVNTQRTDTALQFLDYLMEGPAE